MAKFWGSLDKLIQCVETCWSSTQKTKSFSKNYPSRWRYYEKFEKKPLFTALTLCGFIGNKEKQPKHDTAEEVLHNVTLATIALKDGNVQKSEKMFTKTLNLAETNNFSSTVISACDILSSIAMKFGDYDKAENLLLKALNKLHSQGAAEDNNSVISFNLKLSRLYSDNGNDSLAELGFRNCRNLQKKKIEKNGDDQDALLLWATILYWYGKFLMQRNRYKEAKSCFQDSYLASFKIEKLSPSQVIVILYNLGEVCQLLGEHDDATEHFLKGVSLAKESENPDLGYFYSKLGEVSICKGLYKEAKMWCDVAQKFAIKNKIHGAEMESKMCLEKLNTFHVS